NDRGPFLRSRVIDLSYAAAAKLGIIGQGSDVVVVEAITHADIRSGLNMAKSSPPKATTVAAAAPAPARAPVTPSPAPAVGQVAGPAPASAASAQAGAAKPSAAPTPDALAVLDQKHAQTFTEARSPSPTVTTD